MPAFDQTPWALLDSPEIFESAKYTLSHRSIRFRSVTMAFACQLVCVLVTKSAQPGSNWCHLEVA